MLIDFAMAIAPVRSPFEGLDSELFGDEHDTSTSFAPHSEVPSLTPLEGGSANPGGRRPALHVVPRTEKVRGPGQSPGGLGKGQGRRPPRQAVVAPVLDMRQVLASRMAGRHQLARTIELALTDAELLEPIAIPETGTVRQA